MNVLYGSRFSRDLDAIEALPKIKKRLIKLINRLKEAGTLSELKGTKKIAGYRDYYRVRLSDYRIGLKKMGIGLY